ncbi:MAG: alpha/beta hydrolase-fold protein, partial [Steroidobacteraceae bacterium]|nr:alpha/beta hydrolase-fold protein [Steroidobacteraceae bacterium]
MGNRTLQALLCASLFSATAALAADTAPACQSTVSGDLRLHTLDSKVFGNSRTIRVLLPPGYDAPGNQSRRYPVLYLLDGQNLFDACLSDVSHHEWGV